MVLAAIDGDGHISAAGFVVAHGGLAPFAFQLADFLVIEFERVGDHVDEGAFD